MRIFLYSKLLLSFLLEVCLVSIVTFIVLFDVVLFNVYNLSIIGYFFGHHLSRIVEMQVEDADHIDRLISCLYMALPFVVVWNVFVFMDIYVYVQLYIFLKLISFILFCTQRGASSSKFLNYINKHIIPVFDKVTLTIS